MVVFQINDLVNDPSYRHLSSGMTAELVTRLIQVDGLSVKQYYQPRDKAPLDAIKDRFHLDGDLQKYKNQVRLTMRLTDTGKGNVVVWSSSFDRDLDNPLNLETEVANRVVQGLENRVFAEAPAPVRVQFAGLRAVRSARSLFGLAPSAETATRNPAAYYTYMRGRQLLEERTPAAVRSAIQLLEQAVRDDPEFAMAYATLADAYRALIDGRQSTQDLIAKAKEQAERAVSLNPQLPEAHTALAGVRQMQWDWERSEESYREAIRLDPKSPVGYRRYGG
jgi:adenylate cyclase